MTPIFLYATFVLNTLLCLIIERGNGMKILGQLFIMLVLTLSIGLIAYSDGEYEVYAETCICQDVGGVSCDTCDASGSPPGGCACTLSSGSKSEDTCTGEEEGACNRSTDTCTGKDITSCTPIVYNNACGCEAESTVAEKTWSAEQCDNE